MAQLQRRRDSGQAFPVPLLLAYARRDPLVDPAIGPRLHALVPGAEFRWLEDSSHFAQVDNPDALSAQVEAFLG